MTVALTTPIVRDANAFVDWLATAQPGDACVYYRGHLATDRGTPDGVDRNRLMAAAVAWREYEAGKVHLTQRRHGFHDYAYIATRASKRERKL